MARHIVKKMAWWKLLHDLIFSGLDVKILTYSYETSILVRSHIMKKNADVQEGISQAIRLILKGPWKQQGVKAKSSENLTFY